MSVCVCVQVMQASSILPNPGTLYSGINLIISGLAAAEEEAALQEAMRVMVLLTSKARVAPDDRVWVALLSACQDISARGGGSAAAAARVLQRVLLDCMRDQSLEPYLTSSTLHDLWGGKASADSEGTDGDGPTNPRNRTQTLATPSKGAPPHPGDVVQELLEDLYITPTAKARRQQLLKHMSKLAKRACGKSAALELFGSSASGLAHAHSDLDLQLVELTSSVPVPRREAQRKLRALLSVCV